MKRDRSENRGQSTPLPYILGRSENGNRAETFVFSKLSNCFEKVRA